MEKSKGVIAYGDAPNSSGIGTFYQNWSTRLRARGWQVYSVAIGPYAAGLYDPRFGDDYTRILVPEETDLTRQVQAFSQWVEERRVDLVIPNYETRILAAIPYLDARVRYLTICRSVIRSAYVVSTLYRERLSAAVATTPLQAQKLEAWGVPREKIRFIPHGIDLRKFYCGLAPESYNSDAISLIFVGRVSDDQKGVLWLPKILGKLADWDIPFSLQVIGNGPDLELLRERFASRGLSSMVRFYGTLAQEAVASQLAAAHIFLMPSRFEGFGLVLVEAMAAGCVPIATRLPGVTDSIVEDGINGFLCSLGDVNGFAEVVALLYRDRSRLQGMAAQARKRAREKFDIERMADEYDQLFTEVLQCSPPAWTPRPLEQVPYPRELLPGWRAYIPQPIKNLVRTAANRLFGRII